MSCKNITTEKVGDTLAQTNARTPRLLLMCLLRKVLQLGYAFDRACVEEQREVHLIVVLQQLLLLELMHFS